MSKRELKVQKRLKQLLQTGPAVLSRDTNINISMRSEGHTLGDGTGKHVAVFHFHVLVIPHLKEAVQNGCF